MLCWCKSRVTQGVVSFPTDLMQVGWQVMVNLADGDWFLCYSGYFLLQVMIVGLEEKISCIASGRRNVSRGHFKTCSWISAHSKIKKLTKTSGIMVTTVGFHSRDPCSIPLRVLFTTLLLSWNSCLKLIGGMKFNYANCLS